jgi:urease beta subunit
LFSQTDNNESLKLSKNFIGTYIGLIELNINYERNIIQRPKSQSNLRIGVGYLTDLQVEGRTINATAVQMFGKNNSHLELNLGAKYFFNKTNENNFFLPEVFIGYRYDKPTGKAIFRFGVSYPSLLNIGLGLKL